MEQFITALELVANVIIQQAHHQCLLLQVSQNKMIRL